MCGRFTYKLTWAEIVKLYRLTLDQPARNTQPHYNICPTTTIDTIVSSKDKRALVPTRWGLIPYWWNKPLKEMRLATFNARAETVATKPMFRDAFKSKRCLIPASGYYEWSGVPGNKQPYYFTRRDGQPIITFASLWSSWKGREAGSKCFAHRLFHFVMKASCTDRAGVPMPSGLLGEVSSALLPGTGNA
jgi:putative SOS response-associated peptidase YedK